MIRPRLVRALQNTTKPAFGTIRYFVFLMIPISLGVTLLEASGILYWLAYFAAPLMAFLGLPGEAALVCLSSIFLNVYSAIAVIETLNLSARDITILATFCLIAHGFLIENMILKKSGSSFIKITVYRLFFAFAAAWLLNLVLPPTLQPRYGIIQLPAIGLDFQLLPSLLLAWLISTVLFILRVALIIFAVIFAQKLMDEYGIIKFLGKLSAPLMRPLGLSANAGYVWIVANVIGLVFGSAVLLEEARSGSLSPEDVRLFNNHIALSHSQVEDNFLFLALGVPFFMTALPRFIMAIIVVWFERGCHFLFGKYRR